MIMKFLFSVVSTIISICVYPVVFTNIGVLRYLILIAILIVLNFIPNQKKNTIMYSNPLYTKNVIILNFLDYFISLGFFVIGVLFGGYGIKVGTVFLYIALEYLLLRNILFTSIGVLATKIKVKSDSRDLSKIFISNMLTLFPILCLTAIGSYELKNSIYLQISSVLFSGIVLNEFSVLIRKDNIRISDACIGVSYVQSK